MNKTVTEANKQVVRRFFEELYTGGDISLVDELIAENYVAHGPGSAGNASENESVQAVGREAVRASIESKPPDIRVTIEQQIAEADWVVSRLAFASGGVQWSGVAIQRIEDGKLVETWRITNRQG